MTSVTGQEDWTKADLPDPASTRLYSHTLLPRQEVQAPRPAPQEDQGHQEGALRPREVSQDRQDPAQAEVLPGEEVRHQGVIRDLEEC